MEVLIPLSLFALAAVLAPFLGYDSPPGAGPTWPDAPTTGKEARRLLRF
ncbi:MAG: hypothetical protein JO225_08470 [Candidatus Eremiobacteraeota bacterium]|nr:hypothetical protein [Candidatus Eremiobacteraeota bacterium]MBV8643935.1 hypothetical protein [Candidatus Eremiobacteraeota bacterium]